MLQRFSADNDARMIPDSGTRVVDFNPRPVRDFLNKFQEIGFEI
jgi:hypothetical protein